MPVTASAGGSGVCGGSVPVFGGLSLDLTGISGLLDLDESSLLADVAAGTFGPDLEAALGASGSGYTLGHWPQSMDISTVGGWIACRGAGQYSTRYGKIEDLVVGLEVVLADGTVVHTDGAAPRAAAGPNLTQLFLGSEGTLGVITSARLRVHAEAGRPGPPGPLLPGLHRRPGRLPAGPPPRRDPGGAAPLRRDRVAPQLRPRGLRHGDPRRGGPGGGRRHHADLRRGVRVGDPARRLARRAVAARAQRHLGARPPVEVRHRGRHHRGGGPLVGPAGARRRGRGHAQGDRGHPRRLGARVPRLPRRRLPLLHLRWTTAVPRRRRRQRRALLAGVLLPAGLGRRHRDASLAHGAAVSHHHGIGLNRGRFLPDALGPSFGVLRTLKDALDPEGILNPGKLGLPSPFGPPPWP